MANSPIPLISSERKTVNRKLIINKEQEASVLNFGNVQNSG